jgi:thiazole synthase
VLAIKGDGIGVTNTCTTKNIQSRADGKVNFTAAKASDFLKVGQGIGTAGIGDRERRPFGQVLNEVAVNTCAQALHINGVDQEFGATGGELTKGFASQCNIGELLPAVGDDEIIAATAAATEINHETVPADGLHEGFEASPIHGAIAENPGSDNDMRGTVIKKADCIIEIDATANLEAAGKGAKGSAGGVLVAGAEHDDMAAFESVLAVEFGVIDAGAVRDEIGAWSGGIGERAADDLFHLAFVEINAGAEHQTMITGTGRTVEGHARGSTRRGKGGYAEAMQLVKEPLVIAGREFRSRLILGTGKFSSPEAMRDALAASGAEMVTVALKRVDLSGNKDPFANILEFIDPKRYLLLPNTSGAMNAEEAVRLARLAHAAGLPKWVKLEIHPDPRYLLPDPVETLKAAEILVKEGFIVLPYINADPVLAKRLQDAGAATVMPLGSPIGSNRGLQTRDQLRIIIEQATVPVVVDAGIGTPSHAAEAMELGADAVLVNTAIAVAHDPNWMAIAFRMAVEAGRLAREVGLSEARDTASATSPLTAFLSEQ